MKILGWLMQALGVILLLCAALFFGARLHDGPLGPIPGGALESGEWVREPSADWSFAKDEGEIELQLDSQPLSRTTWILVRDGKAWIPCSLGFPPGKTWYQAAEIDPAATLRIAGKRYPVLLIKDEDASLPEFARSEVTRKYGKPPSSDAGVIFFRIEPHPPLRPSDA